MDMEKEEEVILHHPLHEHPLTLIENPPAGWWCRCCSMIFSGETAYGCSKSCGDVILFHEECAEMPIKIRHPMHPDHILSQKKLGYANAIKCALCGHYVWLGYSCASCSFLIHLGCAASTGLVNLNDEGQSIPHGSHPEHELRLFRRSRRSCSFKCDACGTIEKGNLYICSSTCQCWIHESCALLPPVITRKNLHDHTLSLSFRLPIKYIKFGYDCEVCRKNFIPKYWIYHCEICSYAVHIKCAMNNTSLTATSSSNLINEAIPQFPINDVAEELIKPLVIREGGEIPIPQSINGTYTFPNHNHPLSLNLITSEEESDEKEDDDEYEVRSELICDGCVTPIDPKKTNGNCYYLSCGECKYYFLHWACFHLPPELTSLPRLLHDEPGHKLILKTTSPDEFRFTTCWICYLETSGLFYACTECDYFKVDIKCASLPNTIKHAAHPRHLLTMKYQERGALCSACCYFGLRLGTFYTCDSSCQYSLEIRCALLPATSKHRWDKHPLPLTYDAKINHPEEFYCDICEGDEMNPKEWMYHCRDCDHTFHTRCLTATSGRYRNVKFGQQYVFTSVHPHPLTYQLVTLKRRCSACDRYAYDQPGFQCPLCNFVACPEHVT